MKKFLQNFTKDKISLKTAYGYTLTALVDSLILIAFFYILGWLSFEGIGLSTLIIEWITVSILLALIKSLFISYNKKI